jgi:hypothetical protein
MRIVSKSRAIHKQWSRKHLILKWSMLVQYTEDAWHQGPDKNILACEVGSEGS